MALGAPGRDVHKYCLLPGKPLQEGGLHAAIILMPPLRPSALWSLPTVVVGTHVDAQHVAGFWLHLGSCASKTPVCGQGSHSNRSWFTRGTGRAIPAGLEGPIPSNNITAAFQGPTRLPSAVANGSHVDSPRAAGYWLLYRRYWRKRPCSARVVTW